MQVETSFTPMDVANPQEYIKRQGADGRWPVVPHSAARNDHWKVSSVTVPAGTCTIHVEHIADVCWVEMASALFSPLMSW